jgi:glycosyltransferase involved in cell wall biosynthesis
MSFMDKDSNGQPLRVVVFVPAYNEAKTIGNVVRRIPREIDGVSEVIVVVVDDGSRDGTALLAREAGADFVVHHHVNSGVGQAFKDGIAKALEFGADIIVNLDADEQHNPSEIPMLVAPILEGDCDVVVGSRFINGSTVGMPFMKRLGNSLFTKLMTATTGVHFTDTQSGFRAFSKEAALRLNTFGRFTYTHESLIGLAMNGLRITEVPISVKPRNGESKVVRNCYSYGFKALAIVLRTLRDFKPLAFFGSLGAIALIAGFASGLFVFTRWVLTGMTSGYASLIDFTVLSCLAGLFLMVLALMADMQGRQRRIQEQTLYYMKRMHYDKIATGNQEKQKEAVDFLYNVREKTVEE